MITTNPLAAYLDAIVQGLADKVPLSPAQIREALEVPEGYAFGDRAFPCFGLARQLRQSPQRIAEDLAARFPIGELVESVKAERGYLNFTFHSARLARDTLTSIAELGSAYGSSQEGAGKTVVIDFSSPNIAKPFAIAHLRSTVIGHSLYRILEKRGYWCVGINHLGDWGTQFGAMLYAFRTWGQDLDFSRASVEEIAELYVRFHREEESNPALRDEAREWFRRLEEGDSEARAIWEGLVKVSMREFERIYGELGVQFDAHQGESFYNDRLEPTIQHLRERGLVKEDEGALVVDLSQYGMPACLLRKADGATLYATRDLAAALYRYEQYRFDQMLYVVGASQALHFAQFFKVLELAGHEWARRCLHVPFGAMRFEGEMMRTRLGNVILLEDVLEQAKGLAQAIIEERNPHVEDKEETARRLAIGALFFADLKNDRTLDVDFRWDEALNLEGDTGPYLMYGYVRIAGIHRKAAEREQELGGEPADFGILAMPEERALVLELARYHDVLEDAARVHKPSVVARYALGLTKAFSQFYHRCPVLQAEGDLRAARLILVEGVRTVLKDALWLLGIETVERM